MTPPEKSVYEELGVKPVIHAAGTKTDYGGSRVRPEVLQAMARASESFVSLVELNEAIGGYIASVTGAEAGMVTSGAASACVLSAAACMTGTDVTHVRQLPNTTGMKNEVILQKHHCGRWGFLYPLSGAKLVEVGNVNDCLPEELEAAISERTAAVAFLCGPGVTRTGLTLPDVVALAHDRGLPVLVDAAAMLPQRENLRRYVREGADLVVFSGGKFIRGPQSTGLLFGRKDLIAAAMANASPHHSIGRPQKVSREDMVGLYAALKLYLASDEAQTLAECRQRLRPIVAAIENIPGIIAQVEHDDFRHFVPTLEVRFRPEWTGATGQAIARALYAGEPRIFLVYERSLHALLVNPFNLQPGEPEILATRLREELSKRMAPRL